MKYTVIMPHYRRAAQLRCTLQSFRYWYADRTDYEVVIVEDSKNDDGLRDVVVEFSPGVDISVVVTGQADGYNPSVAFNVGVLAARGQFVVLTNPECLHITNVLAVLDRCFEHAPGSYFVCACESATANSDREFTTPDAFKYEHHMHYQHSEARNLQYHFCSAMSRAQYAAAGGFDERFAKGIGYDDNAFLGRVKAAGIDVVSVDDAKTIHLWHEKLSKTVPRQLHRQLFAHNKQLFANIERGTVKR